MFGKFAWIVSVVLLCAASISGCQQQGQGHKSVSNDPPFVQNQEIVVARGRAGRMDNPPCLRRGMDEVMAAAKGFATQQTSPSYGFLGKDTPVSPITLDDPQATRGITVVIRNVEEELKNAGPEAAKALESQPYSSCGTVAFLLPRNAKQMRVVVSAGAKGGTLQPCNLASGDYTRCQVEQAGWVSFQENRYLVVSFKNWSPQEDRAVKIELFP